MNRPWHQHVVKGQLKEIEIPEISITQLLDKSIVTYSDHIAMTFMGQSYTYKELGESIRKATIALEKLGVRKGDSVAIMLPNCPAYPISFYAAIACGATVVQVNPMYKTSELIHVLNDSNAKIFIGIDKLAPLYESILDQISTEKVILVSVESGSMPVELNDESGSSIGEVIINPLIDVAVLQYTGGTTGTPKGAMLTHYNIVANTLQSEAISSTNTKKGEERVLTAIPLFHVYGMTSGMSLTFYNGGNMILVPRFQVKELVAVIEETKPTSFPGVPTMFVALVDYYKTKKFDLSSITQYTCGSAPFPVEVLKQFNEISGTIVAEGYGLSEASPSTHRNPIEGLQKSGSIGIPLPNTDVKIVDVATGRQTLAIGEVGELVIKGPQVMKGYWKNPEETEHTIRNGWLFTGDLAKMDEDGFFYIVGRKKEMIIAGGFNVYPIEVENVIYEHPAILEAAVIGIPDKYRGETIQAVVVLKEYNHLTEDELIAFCRSHMSAYKVPRSILFVDELPKTAVGKILKRNLQGAVANS